MIKEVDDSIVDITIQTTINDLLNDDEVYSKVEKQMLNISLDMYDGPLDALYNMVLKHKIDIQNIPLSDLSQQLIYYLKNNTDMELTGELLNIATRLLYLKSAFLLRNHKALEDEQVLKEEEEEITRRIKEKLDEYSKYKNLSEVIADRLDFNNRAFFRNAPEIIVQEDFSTENLNTHEIYKTLQHMSELEIENLKSSMIGKMNDSKLKKIYKEKMLRVEDKIKQINDDLEHKNEISISIYIKNYSKEDKIVTFLAILEMSKANEISVSQDINFGEIYIKKA